MYILDVLAELERAEKIHPVWPIDIFHRLAILGEEFGELQKAALQHKYEGASFEPVITEAIHTAAMACRLVKCLEIHKESHV